MLPARPPPPQAQIAGLAREEESGALMLHSHKPSPLRQARAREGGLAGRALPCAFLPPRGANAATLNPDRPRAWGARVGGKRRVSGRQVARQCARVAHRGPGWDEPQARSKDMSRKAEACVLSPQVSRGQRPQRNETPLRRGSGHCAQGRRTWLQGEIYRGDGPRSPPVDAEYERDKSSDIEMVSQPTTLPISECTEHIGPLKKMPVEGGLEFPQLDTGQLRLLTLSRHRRQMGFGALMGQKRWDVVQD
ncbi:uncharacterized protein LOC112546777 isoform X1 [Pelodiscus sinensis]|uniref:uncharacterized protein LOC112546777 isoform X1 n=1 Tax=Pelodiscus sinensis TaxID=13735 RepID=UPI003F6B098F